MSKAAAFKAIGGTMMSYGQNMVNQQNADAAARRQQSLDEMRRTWQIEDREDNQLAMAERAREASEMSTNSAIALRDDAENRPDSVLAREQTQAQTEAANARARASDARAGYYGAQQQNVGAGGVTANTPANVRTVQARAEAMGISLAESWEIQDNVGRDDGSRSARDLTENLFKDGLTGSTGIQSFIYNSPVMSQELGLTPDMAYDTAFKKVRDRVQPMFADKPRRRSAPPAGLINSAGGIPPQYSAVQAEVAKRMGQQGNPEALFEGMVRNGVPEDIARMIIESASTGG